MQITNGRKILVGCILFISVFYNYHCHKELNSTRAAEKTILEQISSHPNFQNWYQFWHERSSYLDIKTLEFTKVQQEEFSLNYRVSLPRWEDLATKSCILDYSPHQEFMADLYADCEFEKIGNTDSLKFLWGDVDRAFAIISLKDSLSFSRTYGPTVYFDECLWLTDSCFVIIGVSFFPTAIADSAYDQVMLIKGNLSTHFLERYLSQKLPRMFNSLDYMLYKYPVVVK
jgi:hypothetical protein